MRLHLEESKPEQKEMPPDIQEALNTWREINKNPHKWAYFEATQFEHTRLVQVNWGVILSDRSKEATIQTITFTLLKDGSVSVGRHTHP